MEIKNDHLLVVSADNIRWAAMSSCGVKLTTFNKRGRCVRTMVDAITWYLRSLGFFGNVIVNIKYLANLCYSGCISNRTFYAAVFELLGDAFGYTVVASESSKNRIVCNCKNLNHYLEIV